MPAGPGTPRLTDVVVVGGGVLGSAAAWSLARRGVGVVLLEQLGPDHVRAAAGSRPRYPASDAGARLLWAELAAEARTPLPGPDAGAAVTALQAAAVAHGAAVRYHRRVTALDVDDEGVVVRSAPGAAVRARAAVVAAGAWTVEDLGDLVRLTPGPTWPWAPPPAGGLLLDQVGAVVVATGSDVMAAPLLGETLADLALGAPAVGVTVRA